MSKHPADMEQERRIAIERDWWEQLDRLHQNPTSFYWKYAQYLEHNGIRSKNRALLQYMALQSNGCTMCPLEDFYKIKLSKYPEKYCVGYKIPRILIMGDLTQHKLSRKLDQQISLLDCGQTIKIGDLECKVSNLIT